MNTDEWDKGYWVSEIGNGLFLDMHWYSDRKNHGDIPGNWVKKTWGNFLGGNWHRVGDWEAKEIRLENIEQGEKALRQMDEGWLKIRGGKNMFGTFSLATTQTILSVDPTACVKDRLREAIRDYKNGKSINTNINFS